MSTEVLALLGDDHDLQSVLRSIPVLSDKMVVDLVNGLEVAGEQVRIRAGKSGLGMRLWESVTGKSHTRDQLIYQNVTEGLRTASVWLQNLQAMQVESDLALARVTRKLIETRAGVVKLLGSHLALKREVEALADRLTDVEQRFVRLAGDVRRIGERQDAKVELDRVFRALEAGRYNEFPAVMQLVAALETLFWGPFGRYYVQEPDAFRNELRDLCVIHLRSCTGLQPYHYRPTAEWLKPVEESRPAQREALAYLLEEAEPGVHPVSAAIFAVAQSQPVNTGGLPHAISPNRISRYLVDESHARLGPFWGKRE